MPSARTCLKKPFSMANMQQDMAKKCYFILFCFIIIIIIIIIIIMDSSVVLLSTKIPKKYTHRARAQPTV